ncbi:MAG: hypothetical protein ABH813_02515, partial [Patescibacteria group bacterium]
MEGLIPLQKITLKEAGKITGYAPDYLGFLLRKGLIKGQKIPKNPPWLVSTADIIKYCKKNKNLATRDSSFLLWRDYLTLKQASEITGYSSDYIGSLIRKKILKGKRFYKLNSWETDKNTIEGYSQYKKSKKFLISSFFWTARNNFHKLFLKISKYAVAFAVFVFIVFGGFAGWAYTAKNQPQTVEIYPIEIINGSMETVSWQGQQNAQGPPQVGPEGDINLFSKNNSAVYSGGVLNLFIQNFLQTEADQPRRLEESGLRPEASEKQKKQLPEMNQEPEGTTTILKTETPVPDASIGTGQAPEIAEINSLPESNTSTEATTTKLTVEAVETATTTEEEIIEPDFSEEEIITEEVFKETAATDTSGIVAGEATEEEIPEEILGDEDVLNNAAGNGSSLEGQIIEEQITPEAIPEAAPEIIPEYSIPVNESEPISLLNRITPIRNFISNGARKIFGRGIVGAQQIPTFDELSEKEFLSAKIKFSFAIGEKTPDILIEHQNIPAQQDNATTGGKSGFWEKMKNLFSVLTEKLDKVSENLVKKLVSIATAEETLVEETSPIEQPTTTEKYKVGPRTD